MIASETEDTMTFYEILSIIGQYVGLGLIFYGIRSMIKGTEQRERESIRRHEENMTALKALIEGQNTLIERTAR